MADLKAHASLKMAKAEIYNIIKRGKDCSLPEC